MPLTQIYITPDLPDLVDELKKKKRDWVQLVLWENNKRKKLPQLVCATFVLAIYFVIYFLYIEELNGRHLQYYYYYDIYLITFSFQLVLTLIMQGFENIFYLIEMMGFSFATVLTCVFAGQVYLRYKEPDLKRPIKVFKCQFCKIEYSQTCPCGHLY